MKSIRNRSGRNLAKRQGLAVESLEPRTLLAADPILNGQSLIISEFVSDSTSTLLTRTRSAIGDEFGGDVESPDWIEIMNVSRESLDVGGMHLTDDVADPSKWSMPAGTSIEAGGLLVVFASGEDIRNPSLDELGYLHTNFRLTGKGEYLALTNRDGSVIHEFAPAYPAQRTDVSYSVPVETRTFIGPEATVEFLVPDDDSHEPDWRSTGFSDPDLQVATSPVGFDRGEGATEPGETIGGEVIDRASVDFARGSIAVMESMPFTEPGRVSEWTVYSEKTSSVTPLILRALGEEFEIVGVGAARTSDGTGVQTFAFDLQSGSDEVDGGGYFVGLKDGDNLTDESGAVVYGRSQTESIRRYSGPFAGKLNPGEQLSGGRSFDREFSVQVSTQARLGGPIQTDVTAAMSGNTSLYARYPFTVQETDALRSLALQIRYDDGFVAYLNGTEVARRNAPATVRFDSTATDNRPLKSANQFEQINISASIGLLTSGENVLAIHGLNDEVDGSDFVIDAKLIGFDIASASSFEYASSSTPGAMNRELFDGFVPATSFSHSRGIYDEALSVTLATPEIADAQIYFTLDGTDPTPENPAATLYQQPLEVNSTTVLRAASYADGYLPSLPLTHTYVLPDDVITQETLQSEVVDNPIWRPQFSDSLKALPTISLVSQETITVEGEIATSAELIFPDGSTGFQVDAGVEVFGGTAVSFPKRSMRLSFKNIYGPTTLQHDLFDDPDGVAEFDQLILRPGSHDTPFWSGSEGVGTYIRNRWTNDRQLEMGQPAPRGRFVHLYLNGTYWGQYQLMERPNAAFMASNFGGDPGDYDVLNAGNPVDGDDVAWNALLDSIGKGYDEVQKYLDVVNYADYILLQFFGGNTIDWRAESNWMAARRREADAGFQFFGWDSDIVLRSGAESDIVNFGGPGRLGTLDGGVQQYPEFRKLLAERAQMYFFDDGMFTSPALRQQIDAFIDELQVSVIAETARWGSGRYTPDTWLGGMEWIKDTYAPVDGTSRAETVIEQMRHAGLFPLSDRPEFAVDGQPVEGEIVAPGSLLTMAAPRGEIYYTLDGSDPWEVEPTVSITSLVGKSSEAKVWIPDSGAAANDWTMPAFDDAAWVTGVNGIGFDVTVEQELSSHVNLDIQQAMQNVNASAYVRVPFEVEDPSQFETLKFSIQYDDGFVAYLNGTEVARRNARGSVTWNSNAREPHANVEAIEFEGFNLTRELGLLRPGKNVLSVHGLNTNVDNTDFLITPLLEAGVVTDTGVAESAVLYDAPITIPAGATVKARTVWTDQWSTLRSAKTSAELLPLRVTEVMFHPASPSESEIAGGFDDDDEFEYIELQNISDAPIDLSGVRFVQTDVGGQSVGVAFDFLDGSIQNLGPGETVLVTENPDAFAARYGSDLPVAGRWSGGLSNNSEQITLQVGDEILQQFTYDDDWYPETDGSGASLEIIDVMDANLEGWNESEGWRASISGGTPGSHTAVIPGDSNGDGIFNSSDFVLVFRAGEYEDDIPGNSTFEEGDWNGDGDFTTADFVFVFRAGTYVAAAIANPGSPQDVAARRLIVDLLRHIDPELDETLGTDAQESLPRPAFELSLTSIDQIFADVDFSEKQHHDRSAAELDLYED